MKRKSHLLMPCAFALTLLCLAFPVPAQDQPVSVTIVNFQDDTGSNVPPELRQKLAQDLQQRLAFGYKDVLPRMISADVDAGASGSLTVEQLSTLGTQSGAKFVVRGGVLAVILEPMIEKHGVTAQLYVEIISVETGSVVATLRGEGKATQADPPTPLSDVDPRSEQFRTSAMGLALAAAVAQLAEPLHQALTTPLAATASVEPPPPTEATAEVDQAGAEVSTTPDEGANAAEVDAELQQLIAQAESILSDGTNATTQAIGAVSQSLDTLKSALSAKASQMEAGQDTARADQDIAAAKQALQTIVAQVTTELTASQETPETAVEQTSPEKKGLLARVDEGASQALSILQKIQQIRATLREADESAAHEEAQQTGSTESATPAEEPVGEVSGAVVDESGNPVEGAEVTEPVSGATATTDSSGVFRLTPVLSERMVEVLVRKGTLQSSAQASVVSGRPTVLDFQLKPVSSLAKRPASTVLPSTVLLNSQQGQGANRGIVTGVVQDAQGRPAPRALVTLKGLGVARTNSQGQYRFHNVPAGTHQLVVAQSGLQTRTAQVQVVARQSSDAKIRFSPTDRIPISLAKASLILPSSATVVKGTVVDSENRPVTGARVSVVQGSTAMAVTTGARGTFELRNLKPGPYRVVVSKSGYEGANQSLTLRTAASESRDFQLKKQTSPLVANVLRNDMARRVVIKGRVRGSDGRVVPNAVVELKPSDRSLASTSVRTNAQGDYSFNARAGQYEIRVRQSSYQPISRALNVRTGGPTQADFSLQTAPTNIAPRIAVQQPTIIGSRTLETPRGQVAGRITDSRTGRPVIGATVLIEGFAPIRTDQQGNYALPNLTAGEYQTRVSSAGYSTESKKISVRPGASSRGDFVLRPLAQQATSPRSVARIDSGVLVQPQTAKPGGVVVQVIDGKTRKPLAGATISITGQRGATSDSSGRFAMTKLLPGTYQVSVSKSGYSSDQRSLVVRSGQTAAATFTLTPRIIAPVKPARKN